MTAVLWARRINFRPLMKLTAFAQWYQYVKRRVQDERVEVMLSHAVAAGESTSLLTCLIEIAANQLEHPNSFDLRALP
jgi:hypothetical protein